MNILSGEENNFRAISNNMSTSGRSGRELERNEVKHGEARAPVNEREEERRGRGGGGGAWSKEGGAGGGEGKGESVLTRG